MNKRTSLQPQELLELYENIFDHSYNWMVVVDADGKIILMNEPYCKFLGFTTEEVIGMHVTNVIENTRMHIVVKTGEREIGDVQQIKGNQMIADRVPIYRDGKIIGAVGSVIFKDIVELDSYVKRVTTMEKELDFYKKELKKALGSRFTFENIIGNSGALEKAKDMALQVSMSKSSILLLGESGTGKELFAHSIHNASPRSNYPLIKVNCASIPSELLESELFGYEPGAFTGAGKNGKPGKFELADNSTIFLDEIGDLPLAMQAKLLRALQEKEIERVGGTKSKKLDVRIIAATNKNLEQMIKDKLFREDLFYRLNVIRITIPSLRERQSDIPMLTKHLIKKLSKEMDRFVTGISEEAMKLLVSYDWPGNIRELENAIERAINLVNKEAVIDVVHLPFYIREQNSELAGMATGEGLRDLVAQLEIKEIKNALEISGKNKQQAAKYLGISRTNLYEKMAKYGL